MSRAFNTFVETFLTLYQMTNVGLSKLKAFIDDKLNAIEICFGIGTKHCGERRKCWFPAFLLFPLCFQMVFLLFPLCFQMVFLLFPLCFQMASFLGSLNVGIV